MIDHTTESIVKAKEAAGKAAAVLVQDGMIVGLGTGSTTRYFIDALGERCRRGLKIHGVPSSLQTTAQANKLGIPLLDSSSIEKIDLTVDGADEIDPWKRMIKGGGGALLREKILANLSRELVIVVDDTKCVEELGHSSLPLEILPFCFKGTFRKLEEAGYRASLRTVGEEIPFITDNGNYIADIFYSKAIADPLKEELKLKQIIGVLETGLFIGLAGRVIVGYRDGHVEFRT